MTNQSEKPQSVLIIGATGRTGLACAKQFATTEPGSRPSIFGLCRNKSKLDGESKNFFDSIIEGDVRNLEDIQRALQVSKADVVIVSVGMGDFVGKSDIRTISAQTLLKTLESNPGDYDQLRLIVISSTGAGGSKIKVGFGIGKFIEHHLRHVLRDHDGQEEAFKQSPFIKRTTIVRPTALTEDLPSGQPLIEFGDLEFSPTIKTDRADLAVWVKEEAMSGKRQGNTVNVTGVKKVKKAN